MISKVKNRVKLLISVTPTELAERWRDVPVSEVIQTAFQRELKHLNLKAMEVPTMVSGVEPLTTQVSALCYPVLTPSDWQGLDFQQSEQWMAEEDWADQVLNQLLDALVERVDFDLPQTMHDHEVRQPIWARPGAPTP